MPARPRPSSNSSARGCRRSRPRTTCWCRRAGTAPRCPNSCARSSAITSIASGSQVSVEGPAAAAQAGSRAKPRPGACTNSPPTRRNMARCRCRPAASTIGWRRLPAAEGDGIEILWTETGGPKVDAARTARFRHPGHRAQSRPLARCRRRPRFPPEGVLCRMIIPAANLASAARSPRNPRPRPDVVSPNGRGRALWRNRGFPKFSRRLGPQEDTRCALPLMSSAAWPRSWRWIIAPPSITIATLQRAGPVFVDGSGDQGRPIYRKGDRTAPARPATDPARRIATRRSGRAARRRHRLSRP